jgi:pimeloyl-ACP methyl ester carboxylesterase
MAKPSIVFAHGLWADGSCFSKLIPVLQAEGHQVMASQHGLDSLKSDVDCVTRCFGRVSGPVVLVGHSYGGTLITHAGTDNQVAALVYIAALAPDADETSQSQQQKFPVTDVFSHIEVADGRIWLKPDGIGCFAGDLPEAEQKLVWALRPGPCPTCSRKRSTASLGGPSRVGTLWLPKIAPSIPIWNASWPSAWAPPRSRPQAATFPCFPSPTSSLM